MADPIRIPLVESIEARLPSSNKDGLASNVFYDKQNNGQLFATKRPGITNYITGSGQASGIYGWNDQLFVFDNEINWYDVIWTGSTFCGITSQISVGYGSANLSMVSTDGLVWRQGLLPTEQFWTGIAWNGTAFCTVGSTSTPGVGVVATSTDGLSWTSRTPPTGSMEDIASNGTNFVSVGFSGATGYAAYSNDNGVTWSNAAIGGTSWRSLAYCAGAGVYCAVRNGTTVATSTNGSSWSSSAITNGDRYTICASPTLFFTPSRNSVTAHISSDGTSWTSVTLPAARNWKHCCWTGSQFLCLDTSEGYIAYSSDGTTWAEVLMSSTYFLNNNNVPVSIAGNSNIIISLLNGLNALQTYFYSQDASLSYVLGNLGINYPYPTTQA